MNRRSFLTALPALALAPAIPEPLSVVVAPKAIPGDPLAQRGIAYAALLNEIWIGYIETPRGPRWIRARDFYKTPGTPSRN